MGVYKTADGWCTLFVLAPGGADFPEFVDWMATHGMAADLLDEPYASLSGSLNMALVTQVMTDPKSAVTVAPQLAHINDVVKAFMASIPSVGAYEEGQGRRLLVGIVSNPKDLAENRQLRERGWYRTIPFDYLKADLEFPGPPYALSATPAIIARPPRLGEHTGQVLASLAASAKEAK